MPGTRREFRPAGLGRRVVSMFYEALLVTALLLGAGFAYAMAAGTESNPRWLFQLYLFLVLGAYFIACWTRGGQTLPMQTWKIRLVDETGKPPRLSRALLRYVLAWPSVVSSAGLLWAFFDRDRQFLHDRLAGTRIALTAQHKQS